MENNEFFDTEPSLLVETNNEDGEAPLPDPEGEKESVKGLSISETIMRFLLMISFFDFIKKHLSDLSPKKLLKSHRHEDER